MKILLSAAAIALSMQYAYAAPQCTGFGKRFEACIAEQDRRIKMEEDRQAHRQWMQNQINPAVESERRAEEIIRNRPKPTPEQLIAEVCRQYAIVDARDRFGYLKSSHYAKLYGECLRGNGINYE